MAERWRPLSENGTCSSSWTSCSRRPRSGDKPPQNKGGVEDLGQVPSHGHCKRWRVGRQRAAPSCWTHSMPSITRSREAARVAAKWGPPKHHMLWPAGSPAAHWPHLKASLEPKQRITVLWLLLTMVPGPPPKPKPPLCLSHIH